MKGNGVSDGKGNLDLLILHLLKWDFLCQILPSQQPCEVEIVLTHAETELQRS